MLHFEGDTTFPLSSAIVWEKLTDARFLVECIPDVESVARCERDTAECTLRPGFSFVRGKLDLTLQVTDPVEKTTVRLLLHTKGIGSSSDVEANLQFTPVDSTTSVHWTADIKELGGLLKAVPRGLTQAAAQKVIADAWERCRQRLGSV